MTTQTIIITHGEYDACGYFDQRGSHKEIKRVVTPVEDHDAGDHMEVGTVKVNGLIIEVWRVIDGCRDWYCY